jgi:hypothetical protein
MTRLIRLLPLAALVSDRLFTQPKGPAKALILRSGVSTSRMSAI